MSYGSSSFCRWRRQSCPDDEGHLCCFGHGDVLVLDGQCQDEFLNRTDPGSDQERINITFRWVKQHVASCSFLRTGVACCLPTCARGFSFSGTELVGKGRFFGFLASPWCPVHFGVLALLVISLVCTRLGFQRCASCWTRLEGGGRWEHYLCYPWGGGGCWAAQKTAGQICCGISGWEGGGERGWVVVVVGFMALSCICKL